MAAETRRVLVVEHEGDAHVGLVGERLIAEGIELHVVGPATDVLIPESLDGVDGLIVLGGSMGPTEDEKAPWLPATRALLAQAVESELPTLGICLGSQLLTTVAGGNVHEMPQGPEVGLHSVKFSAEAADDLLFGAIGETDVPVLQWHWLEAERLPDGAELLASSAGCRNQAFRLGSSAWGVQFHPEVLGDTVQEWADDSVESLLGLGLTVDQVVGEVREAEPQLRAVWGQIAERFAGIVQGR